DRAIKPQLNRQLVCHFRAKRSLWDKSLRRRWGPLGMAMAALAWPLQPGMVLQFFVRRAGGRGSQPWKDSDRCPAQGAAAMSWSVRDTLGRYGLAVLSVLIAFLLKLAAEPL